MSKTEALRAAAENALDVLTYRGDFRNPKRHEKRRKAIEDLREALSESTHPADVSKSGAQIDMAASGEPVAWMWAPSEAWPSDYVMTCYKPRAESAAKNGMKVQPLYAAPHPAPARVPLTDEQIQAAWDSVDMRHPRGDATRNAFARAIEAAHGITGEPK